MTFMRILAADLPAWLSCGWRCVGGHYSESVGCVVLVEWAGAGEARLP